MKILTVLALGALMLALGFMNRDRISEAMGLQRSYGLLVTHEYQIAASIQRVLEQVSTCTSNLSGVGFDPNQISRGGVVDIPRIALAAGVVVQSGGQKWGLRTTQLAITGTGFLDLGPGPVGFHQYRASLRVESEKVAERLPGSRRLASEFPVEVCVETSTQRISTCGPCVGTAPTCWRDGVLCQAGTNCTPRAADDLCSNCCSGSTDNGALPSLCGGGLVSYPPRVCGSGGSPPPCLNPNDVCMLGWCSTDPASIDYCNECCSGSGVDDSSSPPSCGSGAPVLRKICR